MQQCTFFHAIDIFISNVKELVNDMYWKNLSKILIQFMLKEL